MKDNLKKFVQFFLYHLLFPLVAFFIIVICICIFSFTSNAESINPLPYYVNANYSDYFHLTTDQLNLITSYTSTSNENLFWLGEPYNYSSTYWGVYLFGLNTSDTNTISLKSSDLNYDVDYGLFDVDNNYVVVSRTGGTYIKKIIRIHKTTGEWSFANGTTFPSVRDVNLLHLSTKSINEFGYTIGVPFLFQDTQPIYYQGDLNKPIFLNGSPVPPTPEDDNITDDTVKPNWNDYTVDWTTGKPNFDSEHPFDSLFDIMSWSFGKLGDTVIGGFNFIVDSLNWSLQTFLNNVRSKFQLVVDAVNDIGDLIEDFFDNVFGFLSDLKDDFDYLVEPIDTTSISAAFTSTNFYGVKTQFTTLFNVYDQAFDISEPNTFTLIINIQNIETFSYFGCSSPVIIYLGEHFTPIKTALRRFLWVVISFSTVIVVEHGLSNWLRGERKDG